MSREDDIPLNPIVKVLGINWDTDKDDLCFDLKDTVDYSSRPLPTKRSVLELLLFIYLFVLQHKC